MVNKAIVEQTIKKMKDSGIDDDAIKQTLHDVGLGDGEIAQYFKEGAVSKDTNAAKPEYEEITEKTAEKVKKHLEEKSEEQALREETLHAAQDAHAQKLDETHETLSSVHEKVESIARASSPALTLSELQELNKRISTLEEQLSEIKSISKATKSVMEKVLEANRKTLAKL